MRHVDYAARLLFFAVVPFLATLLAAVFPMLGVVINIALTLAVFMFAEAVRAQAERSRIVRTVVKRQLAFEAYYREHPPRPFIFYVLYPLMLPYVVARPITRRELALYRGFTGGSLVILVAAAAFDFYRHWLPELRFSQFLGVWIVLFIIQTLAMFVFLLPISTTVVKLHRESRRTELWVLFGVALVSVTIALGTLIHKRGHIVSWVTAERVMLRTAAAPSLSRAAQLKALHAVFDNYAELRQSIEPDGWVESDSADRAEDELAAFYKSDEAYAFSLHAYPVNMPDVLILQCWTPGGRQPVWRALRKSGQEITDPKDLPKGVLGLPRHPNRKPGKARGGQVKGPGVPRK